MADTDRSEIVDKWTPTFPKRFYKGVTVSEAEGGFTVLLDDLPVRTPNRKMLVLPVHDLASVVAEEFEAQVDNVVPGTMPMTRLANSALDTVAVDMDAVADDFAAYAGSDLLCYRAEAPEGLAERQRAHWDPVLTWARDSLGAGFLCVAGIIHQTQPEDTIAIMRAEARNADSFALCAMHMITTITGSAVLSAAVSRKAVSPDDAWDAAMVDEDWQIEHWGEDLEAIRHREHRKRDFDAACRLLEILSAG